MIDTQQEKFLLTTADQIETLFNERHGSRLLATDDFASGLFRIPRAKALKKKYVETNHENLIFRLCFDIDQNIAHLIHEGFPSVGLPEPSIFVMNPIPTSPSYGRSHVFYELSVPVPRTEVARLKVLRYLAAIEGGIYARLLRENINVDTSYAGLVCKNPNRSDLFDVRGCFKEYELAELAEWVDLVKKPKKPLGLGRNCALFDSLRFYAYAEKRNCANETQLRKACEVVARQKNSEFETPLPESEVKATVKSVAKWTWANFDVQACDKRHRERIERTHTPEIQANRGFKSGLSRFNKTLEKRNQARELRGQGLTQMQIAKELGVSQASVCLWLRG